MFFKKMEKTNADNKIIITFLNSLRHIFKLEYLLDQPGINILLEWETSCNVQWSPRRSIMHMVSAWWQQAERNTKSQDGWILFSSERSGIILRPLTGSLKGRRSMHLHQHAIFKCERTGLGKLVPLGCCLAMKKKISQFQKSELVDNFVIT